MLSQNLNLAVCVVSSQEQDPGSTTPRTAFGLRLQEMRTSHGAAEDVLSSAPGASQPPSPHAGQVHGHREANILSMQSSTASSAVVSCADIESEGPRPASLLQ